jgi:isochorismate synthase
MDFLAYRLPKSPQVVKQTGFFELLENQHEPNGFVISDFLHQQIYSFRPIEEGALFRDFHIHDQVPTVISKRDYQIEAQALLHAFSVCQVEKAVYSRVKQVEFHIGKANELFVSLAEAYPNAFVYLVSSEKFGTWIGATPEVLIEEDGMKLNTVALAGTMKTGEKRLWTDKEHNEHAFVTEHIVSTLKRNHVVEIEVVGPEDAESGPVTHLKTEITGVLTQDNAWEIAMDLHPTPAVCGTPRMASMDLLLSREMHQRNFYTGIIGLVSKNNKQLFVNLRCAQLLGDWAYLYVGGGYTIDSIPDMEWEETENKARTLENYMKKLTT